MGQAFDRDGNVLGEATGESFRQVFDTLHAAHPNAEEIRIKAMREKLDGAVAEAKKPQADRMLQFFSWSHLPEHLQEASRPFGELAERIVAKYPMNPERTVTLRKLLEAKDAAVRTLLYKDV